MPPLTYISHLHLVNFKIFEHAELQLHPCLCLFLGDNGAGKSSILNAIALAISRIFPLCRYVPALTGLPYHLHNVRCVTKTVLGTQRIEYAERSGACCTVRENGEAFPLCVAYPAKAVPGFPASQQKGLAQVYNQCAEKGEGIPVFAYYGPFRGAQQGNRKRFGRRKVNYTNPFAAYLHTLQSDLDFEAFLDWFSALEADELRQQRHNAHYICRELQAVREALERLFSHADCRYSQPRFEANPKRFVMTCETHKGEPSELEFDQLSDGYRSVIAMVADFARRLAIANPVGDANPLDGRGILLIDEVDAHLHPKWQYCVLSDLRRTFPHIQMIVTTHSAEIASMVDKESVYLLEPQDGILIETHPEHQTRGSYPEDIAAQVMEAPNQADKIPAYRDYKLCLAAIQQDRAVGTPEFEAAMERLIQHYGDDHFFVQEVNARLEGLARRKDLLSKLKGMSS